MKYSIEKLLEEIEEGKQHKYLFFWGHQPSKDGTVTQSCFSQWWEQGFVIENTTYATAEHWMMAEKARLFEDEEMLKVILEAKSPGEAKKLGRQVKDFDQDTWVKHRFDIVKEGNLHKFSQNEDLKEFLLTAKKRVIVEASPRDRIWGIGMGKNNDKAQNPVEWRGLNLLGFALMEVRDELSSEE